MEEGNCYWKENSVTAIDGYYMDFELKLGEKLYKGQVLDISANFLIMLNLLELFGKKQYNFMVRNNIELNDKDNKLWEFITEYFKEEENGRI